MKTDEISKHEFMNNKIFSYIFVNEQYMEKLDEFIIAVNSGKTMAAEKLLYIMSHSYCRNCSISIGYRTVYYDFSSYYLSTKPELWNDEDKDTDPEFIVFGKYIKRFYPEYANELEIYDVCFMEEWKYIEIALDLYFNEISDEDEKAAFAYCFYLCCNTYIDCEEDINNIIVNLSKYFNETDKEE